MAVTTISAAPQWQDYATSVGTAWASYVVPNWVRSVVIRNTHASQTLKVGRGYGDGTAYSSGGFTLAASESVAINVCGGQAQGREADRTIDLRGSGASTTVEMLLIGAQ